MPLRGVRRVDPGVRAHEPVARHAHHHAALGPQDLDALVEYHLHQAGVLLLVRGELDGALAGLD